MPRGARLSRRTLPSGLRRTTRPARAGLPGATAQPHPLELAGLLHELTVRLLTADRLTQALDRLATFGASALPGGVVRCSVALIGEGGPLVSAAAGRQVETFDQQQYAQSTGPALEAARNRALVTSTDLAGDQRWPGLAAAARTDGLGALVAVPLDVRRSSVGALSVYLEPAGEIAPELLLTAMAVAGQAEVLLGELHRREVLTEGAEVDRAVGVIIAQRGCGVQEAYAVLHESAQRLGLDRRTVAERLLTAAARNAG